VTCMRMDDKTEVKSLALPETKKDATLLANLLTCLSSTLFVLKPKGH
jgi:hypothetical protein